LTTSQSANLSRGFFALADKVAVVFFGFLNVLFMARMLPSSELGVWVLFTSVAAIFEMIRNGFIRNPFITHLVAADPAEKPSIMTASFVMHIALALFISLVLIGLAFPLADFWNSPGLSGLFLVYALNNLLFIPYHHFEYIQVAHTNFKGIFVANLFRLGLFAFYIAILFFIDVTPSLIHLAWAQSVVTILGCFVGYGFVRDKLSFSRVLRRRDVLELFHYGKFTVGTNISSMFVKNTDSWMIGRLISSAGVALYNPAIRLSNLVEVPTLAIANVFFPQVTRRMKEQGPAGVREIYTKSVSLILALTLPMVVVIYIFAELVILLIFGKAYVGSADILRVTLFYTLIIPFNRQFGTVMDGIKKPKLNFYFLVLVAVQNIILNFFFLRAFGLIGSAYATLVSYCTVFILNQVVLYRMFRINTWKVVLHIAEWYQFGWNLVRARLRGTSPVSK